MKFSLAAVKRKRFPAWASRQVHGLFIRGLGQAPTSYGGFRTGHRILSPPALGTFQIHLHRQNF